MDRIEEIRVLLLSLIQEDNKEYAEKLLDKLQLIERKSGYYLYKKFCSKVANSVYGGHKEEYPSNVLDYMGFMSFGSERTCGWKPNEEVHEKLLKYYEDEIKWRIHD